MCRSLSLSSFVNTLGLSGKKPQKFLTPTVIVLFHPNGGIEPLRVLGAYRFEACTTDHRSSSGQFIRRSNSLYRGLLRCADTLPIGSFAEVGREFGRESMGERSRERERGTLRLLSSLIVFSAVCNVHEETDVIKRMRISAFNPLLA